MILVMLMLLGLDLTYALFISLSILVLNSIENFIIDVAPKFILEVSTSKGCNYSDNFVATI